MKNFALASMISLMMLFSAYTFADANTQALLFAYQPPGQDFTWGPPQYPPPVINGVYYKGNVSVQITITSTAVSTTESTNLTMKAGDHSSILFIMEDPSKAVDIGFVTFTDDSGSSAVNKISYSPDHNGSPAIYSGSSSTNNISIQGQSESGVNLMTIVPQVNFITESSSSK